MAPKKIRLHVYWMRNMHNVMLFEQFALNSFAHNFVRHKLFTNVSLTPPMSLYLFKLNYTTLFNMVSKRVLNPQSLCMRIQAK